MTVTTAAPERGVEDALPDAHDLARRVHANPEIAFEGRQAARWTAHLVRGLWLVEPARRKLRKADG